MSLFAELKRRNVFRVGAAYLVISWLMLQVVDVVLPILELPESVAKIVLLILALGFPLALIFAWAYELTPEGLKRDSEIDPSAPLTRTTGRRLDFIIIAVLTVVVVFMVVERVFFAGAPAPREVVKPVETPKSIAVLPFVNMSADQDNEYFSEGLSEELLNMLVKLPNLRVAARTSSFSYKDQEKQISEIASELGVSYVLEGSVRKSGSQLRITTQLISAEDGFHLWSETYDRTLDDIFQIQDEIAAAVVDALKINLPGMGASTVETNREVYELFLQGRHFFNQRTIEGNEKTVARLEQALAIDPDYAPAWALLSIAYLYQSNGGARDFNTGFESARKFALKAIEIDPGEVSAWSSLGYIQSYYDWDWESAAESYSRSLQLEPGNANVLNGAATLDTMLGQFESAIAMRLEATRLDPLSTFIRDALSYNYISIGQLESAEEVLRELLEIHPRHRRGVLLLIRVLLLKGEPQQALDLLESSGHSESRANWRAIALYSVGRAEEAEAATAEFLSQNGPEKHYWLAQFYAWRGETNEAFEYLLKALEIKHRVLAYILGEAAFYPLHGDPRWEEVLEHMGLLEAWRKVPPEHGGPAPGNNAVFD